MDPFPLEPYRSARLLYRAPEDNPTDDAFFQALYADPSIGSMASHALQRPLSTKERREFRSKIQARMFISVMICLIPDEGSDNDPETIGVISLKEQPPIFAHNRTHELGITIARPYQDKGYGTEAISWMLDWAFSTAGLHRVELTVYEWNERAQRVYQRLGFVSEGRRRECLWKGGRWWDCIHMGILAHEWEKKKKTVVAERSVST
ncbi:putative GNAT family acetyltransferase [Aspergillus unguis]